MRPSTRTSLVKKREKEMDSGYILEGKSVGLVTDRICGRRKREEIRIIRSV